MAPAYRQGEVIKRSRPFAAVPMQVSALTVCNYCLRSTFPSLLGNDPVSLKKCTSCRLAAYCSAECQRSDWSDIHSIECEYLARARQQAIGSDGKVDQAALPDGCILHLARCLLRLFIANESESETDDDDDKREAARMFNALPFSHDGPFDDAIKYHISAFLAGNEQFESLSDEQLFAIEARRHYNMFKVFGNTGKRTWVLSVDASTLPHSCNPSARVMLRQDGFVEVVANREIATEEDVSIAYSFGDNLLPTDIRRFYLTAVHKLARCNCSLCADADRRESVKGPTRDDYLRSIRCPTTIGRRGNGRDSVDLCDAPCPMTREGRPAAEKCANGHALRYQPSQLRKYHKALLVFEKLIRCREQFTQEESEEARKIKAHMYMGRLEEYWHPINGFSLVLLESHCLRKEMLFYCRDEHGRGLPYFFLGKTACGLLACYERYLAPIDRYSFFRRLAQTLQLVGTPRCAGPDEMCSCAAGVAENEVISALLEQLAALAALYVGEDGATDSAPAAIARLSGMTQAERFCAAQANDNAYGNMKQLGKWQAFCRRAIQESKNSPACS